MMIIGIIKFIHLLFTLGLIGVTLACLLLRDKSNDLSLFLHRLLLWFALIAILTGTLLIYPRHFTLHTSWIQAAYLLMLLFGGLVSLFTILRRRNRWRWFYNVGYGVLLILLIGVIHDAVTKTTFL